MTPLSAVRNNYLASTFLVWFGLDLCPWKVMRAAKVKRVQSFSNANHELALC